MSEIDRAMAEHQRRMDEIYAEAEVDMRSALDRAFNPLIYGSLIVGGVCFALLAVLRWLS